MARPRIGQGVVVHVPATTANVGPGFDCLGAALDLDNVFEMRCIAGGSQRFDLIIEGPEGAHLRGGPENLVYRSAQRVWKEAGQQPVALEARVRLAVPPARGLGSSATAIVAHTGQPSLTLISVELYAPMPMKPAWAIET